SMRSLPRARFFALVLALPASAALVASGCGSSGTSAGTGGSPTGTSTLSTGTGGNLGTGGDIGLGGQLDHGPIESIEVTPSAATLVLDNGASGKQPFQVIAHYQDKTTG